MKYLIPFLPILIVGCVSDSQIKEAVRKNPSIVFDVIEENPEQFMDVVNKAARNARKRDFEKRQASDLKNPKQPHLDKNRRLLGTDSASIVVVEYADFQCPACRMAYMSVLAFTKKHQGKVQFYFKNMPLSFHKEAMPASQYLEAIRLQDPTKAYKFYEYVFQHQAELGQGRKFLDKAAKQVGADLKRLAKDVESDTVKGIIAADMAEFEKFGFTGTPSILINGIALAGAPSLEDLERVAEQSVNGYNSGNGKSQPTQ